MFFCEIKELIKSTWHKQVIITHEYDKVALCCTNKVTEILVITTIFLIFDIVNLILCL